MLKRLAIVALLSVSLAGAKSYTIAITRPCQAGTAQLQPGEYTLKLETAKVVLIDKTGSRIETSARVEAADQKFNQTAVVISDTSGTSRIQWIALGGSKSKVVFE